MGVSTDAKICYGILCEEGHEFPWDYHGEDDWWAAVSGYCVPFELYDADGEYLNGEAPSEEKAKEYYNHRREWDKANSLPFEMVNCCSESCPIFIVAVPDSVTSASRGYPEEVSAENLSVPQEAVVRFQEFMGKHLPDVRGDFAWRLSSYWEE